MSSFSLKVIGSIVPADRDERVNAALDYLNGEGFHITMPEERAAKITLAQAATHCGIDCKTVGRRLRHSCCPPFQSAAGQSGRFLWIILNPALEAFLRVKRSKGSSLEIRASAAGVTVS
ncbi:MAG TPA: hypothetical protein VK961_06875 [Chthoniobacter sp.]|nr:hypothetical protein [Chthoniobacter sp.]